jgi:integrase
MKKGSTVPRVLALWLTEWAKKESDEGRLYKKSTGTFEEFTEVFFTDKCDYSNAHNRKHPRTKNYLTGQRMILDNHLLPYFGRMRLSDITVEKLNTFFEQKLIKDKKLLGGVKVVYGCLRIILNYAFRLDKISKNPIKNYPCPIVKERPRDVLTMAEAISLLKPEIWTDEYRLHYILNLVAAKTGCRIGELLVLGPENLIVESYIDDSGQFQRTFTLEIKNSWHPQFGRGSTKNHKTRYVPIAEKTYNLLMELNKPGYLFSPDGLLPIRPAQALKYLYLALEKIGIDKKKRVERGLTFHSWRHFFVSTMREAGMDDSLLRWIVGHSDESIQERYTHRGQTSMNQARNKIIAFPVNF